MEKIIEMDMEQSAFDVGNSSIASLDDESKKFENSAGETKALQDLAKISKQMINLSDSFQDLDFSFNEGMEVSLQDFTISVSDALDFSSHNSKVSKKLASKKARESAFLNTLVFSPEITNIKKVDSSDKVEDRSLESSIQDLMLEEKSNGSKKESSFMESLVFQPDVSEKSKITENLEPGDIVFDPQVSKSETEVPEPKVEVEDEVMDLRSSLKARPKLVQRNSCGTIYAESTMSAPDKHATIKCVCGVFRAHILGSEKEDNDIGIPYGYMQDKFRLFNDRESERNQVAPVIEGLIQDSDNTGIEKEIPSLDTITEFYRNVFTRAQMEADCIIMSLIYVERLIKATEGLLVPRRSNWRSLLFSCMILASKVCDDMSMWNSDFSQTCPPGVYFSLQRINELELAILKALVYKVKVPASEYAKYYFLLRSMLIKSGLGGDELQKMNPLDVEGAKKLEQISSNFQKVVDIKRRAKQEEMLRSKSLTVTTKEMFQGKRIGVSLEHMMNM